MVSIHCGVIRQWAKTPQRRDLMPLASIEVLQSQWNKIISEISSGRCSSDGYGEWQVGANQQQKYNQEIMQIK